MHNAFGMTPEGKVLHTQLKDWNIAAVGTREEVEKDSQIFAIPVPLVWDSVTENPDGPGPAPLGHCPGIGAARATSEGSCQPQDTDPMDSSTTLRDLWAWCVCGISSTKGCEWRSLGCRMFKKFQVSRLL